MFCKNCGANLQPEMKFCANCGTPCEEKTAETTIPEEAVSAPVNGAEISATQVGEQAPSLGMGSVSTIPVTPSTSVETTPTPVNTVSPQVVGTASNPQPVYPQAPMQPQNKKKDYIFIIVIVVIGLALIAIPILLNMNKDNKKSSNSNTTSNSNSNSYSNNNNNHYSNSNFNSNSYSSNTNNNYSNNNSTVKTVTYGNYIFTVPARVKASVDSDGMTVENLRTSSDMGIFIIQEGVSYDEIKEQKDLMNIMLQASVNGATIGEMTVKTYQGIEFLVMPITQEGIYFVCGFSKLSDTEFMMTMLVNERGTLDYTLLNEAAEILKTVKRKGTSGM